MIELRPEGDDATVLDELVGNGCDVHLERMSDGWFCLIVEDGQRRVMINIGAKRAKVRAGVYDDHSVERAPVQPSATQTTICAECGCVFGAHRDHCSIASDPTPQPADALDAARYRWVCSQLSWRDWYDMVGLNAGATQAEIDAKIDKARAADPTNATHE